MLCQERDLNQCLPHSLLFFFLVSDRINTLAAMETGRIEKEKTEGKGQGKGRRKDRGEEGGKRKMQYP